jgi:hypothetical protein
MTGKVNEKSWGRNWLLQPRVLRFGLLQDGDVGVGVFPEGEEIFVSGERPDAGGIGINSLRSSRLQGVRTSHSKMLQRSCPAVPDDAAVIENLLKLGSGSAALSGCKVYLSANVGRIEAGNVVDKHDLTQLHPGTGLAAQPANTRTRPVNSNRFRLLLLDSL